MYGQNPTPSSTTTPQHTSTSQSQQWTPHRVDTRPISQAELYTVRLLSVLADEGARRPGPRTAQLNRTAPKPRRTLCTRDPDATAVIHQSEVFAANLFEAALRREREDTPEATTLKCNAYQARPRPEVMTPPPPMTEEEVWLERPTVSKLTRVSRATTALDPIQPHRPNALGSMTEPSLIDLSPPWARRAFQQTPSVAPTLGGGDPAPAQAMPQQPSIAFPAGPRRYSTALHSLVEAALWVTVAFVAVVTVLLWALIAWGLAH
ncbi:MAG: hypothetical protein AAFX99_19320 [Myxococcota bacterium]